MRAKNIELENKVLNVNFESANSDFTALYGIRTSANVRYLKGISGVLQEFVKESD